MQKATPGFTYDAIIGAQPLTFPWYTDVLINAEERPAADGALFEEVLSWNLTFSTDEDDEHQTYAVDHDTVMKTIRKIVNRKIKVGQRCEENCKLVHFGRLDEVDFDADTADQVLQAAAFGEVVYG